jgi:hypothetical protein
MARVYDNMNKRYFDDKTGLPCQPFIPGHDPASLPGDAIEIGGADAQEFAARLGLNKATGPAARKDDGGKAPWSLLMRGCAEGMAGVVAVLKFGASKYAADSWQKVENAEERYKDALYRHLHSIERNGFMSKDPETGLLEWFHVACNALFLATFAAFKARAEAEKETH